VPVCAPACVRVNLGLGVERKRAPPLPIAHAGQVGSAIWLELRPLSQGSFCNSFKLPSLAMALKLNLKVGASAGPGGRRLQGGYQVDINGQVRLGQVHDSAEV
jgi:hypothetical protein